MELLGTLIGCLSLVVALAALWLASETRRRAEGETVQFIRTQVATLRAEIQEARSAATAVDKRLKSVERMAEVDQKRAMEALRDEMAALRAEIGMLKDAGAGARRSHPSFPH